MNTNWKDELDKESKKQFIEHKGYIHISFIIPFIESLLKGQRESCDEMYKKNTNTLEINSHTSYLILNAPEPSGVKK